MSVKLSVEIPDGVTHAYLYVQAPNDLTRKGFTLVHAQQGIKLWKKDLAGTYSKSGILLGGADIFLNGKPRKW
jgi:hypothetical protein